MTESLLTPAHAHPLKTLLNKPFTGAFHKATSDRNLLLLKLLVLNMSQMSGEIVVYIVDRILLFLIQPLSQGLLQIR